jgi:DNA polymerase-3 subunit delta'
LTYIAKPADRSRVQIEQLVGGDSGPGLIHKISLKPYYGGRKIGIIDDADTLAHGQGESANCLLKTLEEPPPKSVLILIGSSEQRQLPTIRSRSQVVRFAPLAQEIVSRLAVEQQIVTDPTLAAQLAELAGGSLESARALADDEVREFRGRWLKFLADPQPESVPLAAALSSFITAAGKEAPPRRARIKLFAQIAIDFYRELIRALQGIAPQGDAELIRAATQAARAWNREVEWAARALERCLDTFQQVDANANQATLLEAWVDDLAQARLR